MMDCILPIRIEDFRFRIVVRVEMQSKSGYSHNCALLDFHNIIGNILVAFPLNPGIKYRYYECQSLRIQSADYALRSLTVQFANLLFLGGI